MGVRYNEKISGRDCFFEGVRKGISFSGGSLGTGPPPPPPLTVWGLFLFRLATVEGGGGG